MRDPGLLQLFLLALGVLGAAPALAAAACATDAGERVEITAVEPRLELRLADARVVRLAGVDPTQATPDAPDLAETTRQALAARVVGKTAELRLLATTPDRWGRLPAQVALADGTSPQTDLAVAVIAAGQARYLAEPAAAACRDDLLRAEEKARSAALGLWADPYYAVLAVDDLVGFKERSGTIVLAEGRLTAVQPGPYRTTLRIAAPGSERSGHDSHGGRMLVATVPPRTIKIFDAQKIDFAAWIGQRLRWRGLLDLRFGPRVELTGPDTVEVIPASSDARSAAKPN